jgi:hypothetical protein
LLKQFNRKSYLGEACAAAINTQIEKMTDIDKGVVYANKEKVTYLESQLAQMENDVNSYQIQAE